MNLLGETGCWFKANLHTHTTCSDGKLEPREAIELYRSMGYRILALTDHRKLSRGATDGNMLLLSGIELDTNEGFMAWHVVGIGAEYIPEPVQDRGPQALIDAVCAAGGAAILAHPAWSLLRPDRIRELTGLTGAEVMNSVSMLPHNGDRGDSSSVLDVTASMGRLLPFMAADDTHFYDGEQGRSWTWIHAGSLTREAVLGALRSGHFFASQGPRFFSITSENGFMKVESSPAAEAVFYSDRPWSRERVRRSSNGRTFTYPIGEGDHYVRCELIDADGRKAWSRPFRTEHREVIP